MSLRRLLPVLLLAISAASAQTSAPAAPRPPATLRSVLLEQLRSTHTHSEWFVCAQVAIANLAPEQARWTDGKNHSVGQLVNHLVYWDTHALAQFRGEKPSTVSDNDETFNAFDATNWPETVRKLDAVMSAWEQAVEKADDATILKFAGMIAHVGSHNAYHVGEIVMVRKAQGAWNPDEGVKL